MKPNKNVEAFINDPDAIAATVKKIESSREKNLNFELVSKLNTAFAADTQPQQAQLAAIVKAYSTQAIAEIMAETMQHQANDDFYVYPLAGHTSTFAQRIILANTDHYDLSIDMIDAKQLNNYKAESKQNLAQRGIQFWGRETMTYFIHTGGLKVSSWRHDVSTDNFVEQYCHHAGTRALDDGEVIFSRANETIMYESADENVLAISLEFKANKAPVTLMFSAADQQLKFQNPSDELDSRIQLSMLLLKKLDYAKAIPTLKKYLTSSSHFIRWYAMQQILGIDALTVLDELAQMAQEDDHHEVRLAAQQTLDIIRQKEFSHAC
ncbi:hypothetical protein [uncultured Ferrimonas sp.]|uniref:hypothetical protein n=1 Tax=uncultured Ferrimonas sp. TaxID=432640 RepID=UPI0026372EA9|nr:hypothetical protein [uncultured Ferrimonas sp.]